MIQTKLIIPVTALAVILLTGLVPLRAGTFVTNNFSDGSDAATGISIDTTYTHLVDINKDSDTAIINGVAFDNTLADYTLTGAGNSYPNWNAGASGAGVSNLLNNFRYGGNPAVLTVKGLTPGAAYKLRIYVAGWTGSSVTFSFDDTDPATVVGPGVDRGAGQADPSSFDYTYTLGDGDTDLAVTISPDSGTDTMHLYGFSNEDISALSVAVTSPTHGQQFLLGSSVTATVEVVSGEAPYDVTLYTNGASAWSTNGSAANLFTIELGALADGPYATYATVSDNLASNAASATSTFSVVSSDTGAPNPDPMSFAVAPVSLDTNMIVMIASTATDTLSPPVLYYFENTTNSDNSGWISSTVWTNTGLTEGTTYGYQVKARDSATPSNETAYSDVLTAVPSEPNVTWDNDGNGNWSDISNWNGGAGPVADGEDTTAVFTNITANRTVTLDTDRTIGHINAVDATHNFTIAGNTLTLDVSSGSPAIGVVTGRTLTISSALAGSDGFTKSGPGTLTLSGGYALTGDVILNDGRVGISAYATISALSGMGALHRTSQNGTFTIQDGSAFHGELRTFAGGNSSHTIQFQSMGDAVGAGNLQTGGGTGDSNQRTKYRLYGDVGPLIFTNRAVEILAKGATPSRWSARGTRLDNDNSAAVNRWVITTDLVNETDRSHELILMGSNTGSNEFSGVIGNSTGIGGQGAFYSTQTGALKVLKEEGGKWILSGSNTYSGGTTVSAGTLVASGTNSLGRGNVTVSSSSAQLVIDAEGAMTNTAKLYLPSASSSVLTMNADLQVAELYVAGLRQPNGTYTTNNAPWMAGASSLNVGADVLYWDPDGDANPGVNTPTPNGTWDAGSSFWNNAAGLGAAQPWSPGLGAVFSAGSDATGSYTVVVDSQQDISGLNFKDGKLVTIMGSTGLRMVADSVVAVAAAVTANVAVVISEDASARGLTKISDGTLVFSEANTYTGPTEVEAGTLEIGVDTTLSSNLVFSGTHGTVNGDRNLNFGAGAVIDSDGSYASSSDPGGAVHKVSCGVSGNPEVRLRKSQWRGYDARCKQNRFEPSGTNTQAIGAIRFNYYNSSGAGARVVLGGSSTNNTVETFIAPYHSYDDRLQKEGPGTWTITGDSAGQYYGIDIYVEGGTLIWTGSHSTGGAYSIRNGRFAGNHNYTTTYDARGNITVRSSGILSPGVGGVGTMTFGWVGTLNGDGRFHMQDGSIYEYDVGATTNDIIHLSGTTSRTQTLELDDFVLKIQDAGGNPKGEPLAVFTYDANMVVDMSGFSNAETNFDFSDPAVSSWGNAGVLLTNDVAASTIYLVGLNKPPSGSVLIVR